jgi:hypothetical protein
MSQWGSLKYHKGYEVYGWTSQERIEQAEEISKDLKNGVLVEVGVYGGTSIFPLVEHYRKNNNIIYAIDPWEKNDLSNGEPLSETTTPKLSEFHSKMKQNRLNVEKIVKELSYDDVVKVVHDFSENASKNFNDESVDILYIDGSHAYESVLNDLRCWLKKIKKGGVIWGDDLTPGHPGVGRALQTFTKENQEFQVQRMGATGWRLVKSE